MNYEIHALREAYRLFRSENQVETVLAVMLVAVVVGPVMWKYRKERERPVNRGGNGFTR